VVPVGGGEVDAVPEGQLPAAVDNSAGNVDNSVGADNSASSGADSPSDNGADTSIDPPAVTPAPKAAPLVALVSYCHGPKFAEIGKWATLNHKSYAARHGYDFIQGDDQLMPHMHFMVRAGTTIQLEGLTDASSPIH
jgi:hypothetical protein